MAALIGETIKLTATFRNYQDEPADPDEHPLLRVYTWDRVQVGADVQLDATHRTDTGMYEVEYVVPDAGAAALVIEFSAPLGGQPVVERSVLEVAWVESA